MLHLHKSITEYQNTEKPFGLRTFWNSYGMNIRLKCYNNIIGMLMASTVDSSNSCCFKIQR